MISHKFIIQGNPIPKARHRTYVVGKFVKTYDIQCDKKKKTSLDFISQMVKKELKPFPGYLNVRMDFFFEPAKSMSSPKRNICFWMDFPTICDLDNLAKFYLDCCNNIVFNDDRQITSLTCRKFFSKNPRTEIIIMPRNNSVDEDVTTILGIYGQDQLVNFIEIAYELLQLYNADEHSDWVKEEIQSDDDEVRVVRLTRTAYLLSKLAYEHADLLKKVHRKCPSFWKKAERIADLENKKEVKDEVETT